jgi:predicted nucleic acid-binding protein
MIFVLDASMALSWCFEDEASRYSNDVLDSLSSDTGIAPPLWPLEVSNGLLMAERRNRTTPQTAAKFLEQLVKLPLQISSRGDLSIAEDLLDCGRKYGLTAYDSCYLLLALKEGHPLATEDKLLRKACRRAGVALYRP